MDANRLFICGIALRLGQCKDRFSSPVIGTPEAVQ
jgi:hypothetical protein